MTANKYLTLDKKLILTKSDLHNTRKNSNNYNKIKLKTTKKSKIEKN